VWWQSLEFFFNRSVTVLGVRVAGMRDSFVLSCIAVTGIKFVEWNVVTFPTS
jgi:hypothetical protein